MDTEKQRQRDTKIWRYQAYALCLQITSQTSPLSSPAAVKPGPSIPHHYKGHLFRKGFHTCLSPYSHFPTVYPHRMRSSMSFLCSKPPRPLISPTGPIRSAPVCLFSLSHTYFQFVFTRSNHTDTQLLPEYWSQSYCSC